MVKWFLAWRREAEVTKAWEDVFDLFEFAETVEQGSNEAEYFVQRKGLIFDRRFEWRVEPGDGAIRVIEDSYLSGTWFLSAFLTLIGSLVFLVLGRNSTGIYNPLFLLICVVLISVFMILVPKAFQYRGELTDFFNSQADHDNFHPFLSILLLVLFAVLSGFYLESISSYLPVLVVATGFVLYYGYPEIVERYSLRWQRRFINNLKSLPMIVSDYVLLLIYLSLPLIFFLLVYNLEIFVLLVEAFPTITFLIYSVAVIILFWVVAAIGMKNRYQVGKTRFKSREVENLGNATFLSTGVLALCTSLPFMYLCYVFLAAGMEFISLIPTLQARGIVFVSSLPLIFLTLGFCYQILTFISGFYSLVSKMYRDDLADEYSTEVPVYLLDHSGYFAGAGSLFWKDFIVVSKKLFEDLERGEVEAIIAHEECHIVENDSSLAVFIALFSPVVGLGRNVVYSLFDYKSREFRADSYASEKAGQSQVISALEKLRSLKVESAVKRKADLSTVTPTLTPVIDEEDPNTDSIFDRYYGLYFGNFAVSEVHPSLDERIRRLK